ncbi:MAG: dihydroneopterin aldolase [Opitutales bacterium]
MNQNKIELKGLGFYAYHGATDEEARLGQRFYVDLCLGLSADLRFHDDALEQTVNYAEVYEVAAAAFQDSRYRLIEAAGEAVASAVLDAFAPVQEVRVVVRKPSVPVDCICDYFAVEVVRCR